MAVGNPWFSAVEQTLPQYVPLPFNELMAAGQQLQQRYDINLAGLEETAQGLASIEARLPGHQRYVSDFANRYRTEADQLLQRYNNNAADPQFTRELSRLKSKYVNDPNLRTIMMANESAKRNDELAAKMAAEGRLFINPQARGIDDQGRIINDVGTVRGVNTLDQWRQRLATAHQSMINDGRGWETNEPNLRQAQQEIMSAIQSGAPEVRDLIQAYQSQGLTPEQAAQQVAQDAQRLSGEFGVRRDRDYQYDNLQLSRERFAFEKEDRARSLALQKAKVDMDVKANQEGSLGTYFVPTAQITPDNKGIAAQRTKVGDIEIPLAGKMNVAINTPIKSPIPLTGDITRIGKNKFGIFSGNGIFNDINKRGEQTVEIEEGTFHGVQVPYVISSIEGDGGAHADKVGSILSRDKGSWLMFGSDGTSKSTDIKTDEKGPFVYIDDDRKIKAYLQPQAMAVYKDSKKDETLFVKLNRDETLTYLGPQAGKLANDGQDDVAFDRLDDNTKLQVVQGLQQRGYDPSKLSQRQLNNLTQQLMDEAFYNQRKAPLFAKPSTTTPFTENYYGQ